MLELYKKLMDEKVKKDAEMAKNSHIEEKKEEEVKKEEKKINPEDEISEGDEDEDKDELLLLLSGKDTKLTLEQIRKKLKNPKRLAKLLNRLAKDENLKNMFLQRTDNDIEALQACELVMGNFFSPGRFEDFDKANLAISRFTPIVDIPKEVQNETENEELNNSLTKTIDSKPKQLLSDEEKRKNSEDIGKIIARHIGFKFADAENEMKKIIDRASQNYEELVNNPEIKQMVPNDKVKALKYHLMILEQIINGRQTAVQELSQQISHKPLHVKNNSMPEINIAGPRTPSQTSTMLPEIKQQKRMNDTCLSDKKRYKVNIELIKKRGKMSQLEKMERRYHFITEKCPATNAGFSCFTPRPIC